MGARFLAFDLGAESGRVIAARLHAGVLELAEARRFPNEAVRVDGSLYWDMPRLWRQFRPLLSNPHAYVIWMIMLECAGRPLPVCGSYGG